MATAPCLVGEAAVRGAAVSHNAVMNDVLTYLQTQLATFDEVPFNAVDSALLAQFCMARGEGVMPQVYRAQVSGGAASPKARAGHGALGELRGLLGRLRGRVGERAGERAGLRAAKEGADARADDPLAGPQGLGTAGTKAASMEKVAELSPAARRDRAEMTQDATAPLDPVRFADLVRAELFPTMFSGMHAAQMKQQLFWMAASPRFRDLCRTATILAKTLRDFMNQYPGVVIDLVEVESKDIGELLREGSVDFCLTLSSRIMPTMESRVVSRERVFLAVPASCSKATLGGRPSKPSDNTPKTHFLEFKNEPFVLVNHGMKFNELYFSLCQKYGVEPKVILQSESINIVHDVVSHGLGCSLVPEELAYCTCTAECRPYYFDLSEELPENPVVVAWSKERYLSKASQIFINNLIKDTKDYSGCTSCSN